MLRVNKAYDLFTLAVSGIETGTGMNGLCAHFPGAETVSGGVFQ